VNGNQGACRCFERRSAQKHALASVGVLCCIRTRHSATPLHLGHNLLHHQRIIAPRGKVPL
jgi:hypothetical protein